MISVADIKENLPNWPVDVIDDWLLYFANEPECGWRRRQSRSVIIAGPAFSAIGRFHGGKM
jgi:hypothetical protein